MCPTFASQWICALHDRSIVASLSLLAQLFQLFQLLELLELTRRATTQAQPRLAFRLSVKSFSFGTCDSGDGGEKSEQARRMSRSPQQERKNVLLIEEGMFWSM
jgi:hypothetical protein